MPKEKTWPVTIRPCRDQNAYSATVYVEAPTAWQAAMAAARQGLWPDEPFVLEVGTPIN